MPRVPDVPDIRNRRRHERRNEELPLLLIGQDRTPIDIAPTLRDVSRGGMGFVTDAVLKPGDLLRFKMEVPGRGCVTGTAKVRWSRLNPTGMAYLCGAEFESLGWGHAARLRTYLDPFSGGPFKLLDWTLGAANCLVAVLVLRELSKDPQAQAAVTGFAAKHADNLPFAFLGAGLIIGAALLFRK